MSPMIAEPYVRLSISYPEDVSEAEAATAACEALNKAIERADLNADEREALDSLRFLQVGEPNIILSQNEG